MEFHTTNKGTKLPLRDIRGKLYMDVAWRVVWMREEKPDWQVHTFLINSNEKGSMFRAAILDSQGRTIATGHKYQNASFPNHEAKAETQAIGRALALAGYGTAHALADFEDETDDPANLPDSSLERPKPQSNPVPPGYSPNSVYANPGTFQINFGKYKGKTLDDIGMNAAIGYADFLRKSDKPSQQSKAFVEAVDRWVESTNPQPPSSLEPPPEWLNEDVP